MKSFLLFIFVHLDYINLTIIKKQLILLLIFTFLNNKTLNGKVKDC